MRLGDWHSEQFGEMEGTRQVSREAACLAHDQNNLLQIAFEKVRVIRIQSEGDAILERQIDELEQVLERMELLNRSALTGFRASAGFDAFDVIDPDIVIDQAVDMAKSMRAHGFRIERSRPEKRIKAPIHSAHLQQVVLNLLKNAVEAIPERDGLIRVETSLWQRHSPDFPGIRRDVLHLIVTDNGPGIPDDIRRSIFQFGHSTKGEGHGLGLFYAREILGHYGGSIVLDNCKDRGTRIVVDWPFRHLE